MWVSDELQAVLDQLTGRQARAVERIVRAEIEGLPFSALLEGPRKICAWKTYHGSGKSRGWKHKPAFQTALRLARRDYRTWLLEHGTEEALTILADTAPEASRALRQKVMGDRPAVAALIAVLGSDNPELRGHAARLLGETGLPGVTLALETALAREDDDGTRLALVEALGIVASGAGRDDRAAESVLDRAAVKTASKSVRGLTGGEGGPIEVQTGPDWAGMDEDELDDVIANLLAATNLQSPVGRGLVGEDAPAEPEPEGEDDEATGGA